MDAFMGDQVDRWIDEWKREREGWRQVGVKGKRFKIGKERERQWRALKGPQRIRGRGGGFRKRRGRGRAGLGRRRGKNRVWEWGRRLLRGWGRLKLESEESVRQTFFTHSAWS
eukprot:6213209-Pleurochrysis_carterae.AAC.6